MTRRAAAISKAPQPPAAAGMTRRGNSRMGPQPRTTQGASNRRRATGHDRAKDHWVRHSPQHGAKDRRRRGKKVTPHRANESCIYS